MKQKRTMLMAMGLCTALAGMAQRYTLTGDFSSIHEKLLEKVENKMIYVVNSHSNVRMDSALVQNGKFSLQGTVDGDSVCYIAIGANRLPFVREAGDIRLDGFEYSGTPLNDRLKACSAETVEVNKRLGEQFKQLQADTNLSDADKAAKRQELMKQYHEGVRAVYVRYLKENPNNPLNALLIEKWTGRGDDLKVWDEAMSLAGDYAKQYRPLTREMPRMERLRKVQEGMMFTDFTVEHGNLDGSPAKFSDYIGKGKYILVDFWASWCGPCRGEIPNIKKVYEKYKGDRFDVLSVAVWDKHERTLKALEEEKMPWPQIIDSEKLATEPYGIIGIPQIMLFAPDGTIYKKGLRGTTVEEVVREALSK